MLQKFETHLRRGNMSEHTISAYLYAVKYYQEHYPALDKANLLAFKGYLLENFKPKTVNLRIQAINKFLQMLKKGLRNVFSVNSPNLSRQPFR